MSWGRILLAIIAMFVIAGFVYSGLWHVITLFAWQHPILTWVPLLAFVAIGYGAGAVRMLASNRAPAADTGSLAAATEAGPVVAAESGTRVRLWFGPAFLAALAIFLYGLFMTLFSSPSYEVSYELVETLPQRTQPRLLPRSGVDDDPSFRDTKETHLLRDPVNGELIWSGEWQASTFGGPSAGVAVRPLDDLIAESTIQRTGFDHSVAGVTPSTFKGKAWLDHPFSRIQYPILVPNGEDEAFAIAPYMGYEGFPFKRPYLKGVLVYHQDGTIEDLTPEQAARRPELVRSGRIVPEAVARSEAEAIASSDEIDGEIVDGKGNKQPFLTSIDRERTVWLTIIDGKGHAAGVRALVLKDSTTGETQVWMPPEDRPLIPAEDVLNQARALPLRWEEERCCDSEGNSYTVTLREVVEPRLAFKDGRPYYLVTVVPTDELALNREVEYTLLIDGETGEELDRFEHANGGLKEDVRLQAFFTEQDEG